MKNCFDPRCKAAPVKTLRGLKMCVGHYIEALEHSAHLEFYVGPWDGKTSEQKKRAINSIASGARGSADRGASVVAEVPGETKP